MPQILVVTDGSEDARAVVYRERIAPSDLESDHFSGQLVERVGWALHDADEIEQQAQKGSRKPASTASLSDDPETDGEAVEIDRMDLALAVGAGLDRAVLADQLR
jgi:hypothetical protein